MSNIRKGLDKFLEVLCSAVLAIMIFVVLYQIFTRTVLKNPNTVTEELVRFSLVWLSLLGAAYAAGRRVHLSVTLLSDNLSEKNRKLLYKVIQVLFIIFASIVMVFGGFKAVSVTMGQISPSLSIPMGFVYLAVPVSGILILIYSILNLLEGNIKKEGEV